SFPALARIWSEIICQWIQKVGELVHRIDVDRELIARTFFAGRDPGPVRAVKFGISDPHNGGRETVIARFDRGRVVYKPRSGENERAWFSLLRWINGQGLLPEFRILRVLCRPQYCWVEFVTPRPCENNVQIKNYYRRAGRLLCITYLIGAIDCHCDNLIAAGDQPVLIDAETLLHRQPESSAYEGAAALLTTGLLPVPNGSDADTYRVSGLGGTEIGPHTATLNGRPVRLSAYSSELSRGFREMWSLLAKSGTQAQWGFRRQIHRLEALRWRRIYSPTSKYVFIRNASLDPFALRSGVQRRRMIENMLRRKGVDESTLRREIRAIINLDIPYFTDRPRANFRQAAALSLPHALKWIRSASRSL
ncbi:MAG: type 2 lantipeptide synthetase LanM, partial [Verrucomicrobia bacterium]|nr:type 2 lantipeptide synthetase LanM [Verrucomicrobiota bacterium]